jgi:hypothetical protein
MFLRNQSGPAVLDLPVFSHASKCGILLMIGGPRAINDY